MNMTDDGPLFAGDDEPAAPDGSGASGTWKLLIVDDEPEVHQITLLALEGFRFENKTLEFLHAYSAGEAIPLIEANPDIALMLLDVVMETEHAGLDLVRYLREEAGNRSIRIVLRTGQPGKAPEREVISNYDINDYTEKSDLTAQKLFTLVVAGLRAYRDILELENSRRELLASNNHLACERQRIQVTLDSIGDAVLTTDQAGCVTHLNPVAEALTGWRTGAARGRPLADVFRIINARTRMPVANPVEKVLQSGKIVGLANHTVLISRDGTEYQIADSGAPIRDSNGKILGVVLVFRDVTRQYQTEEALRRAHKMEAIGRLCGGIAHDFNNQLGVVIGYLDFLKEHFPEQATARQWVDTAARATQRCVELTRQLLVFSRRQGSGKKVVDLNRMFRDLEIMISRAVTPEVETRYFLADDLWLTEVNPGEFQDAVLNLVINARDAMPGGGQLVIETANKHLDAGYTEINPGVRPGDYVQVVLSDTGTGMDREVLEHLFEPFFTTKSEEEGTGLGLAMVYGFTKRYGGHIKVYSEPGVGTTIRLYLPRSEALGSVVTADDQPAAELPAGNESILIVDDEGALLQLAARFLRDLGYRTRLAENGSQALAILAEEEQIDLLFSDVVMPGGMNGYELARRATELRPGLKVLLTSGFTSKTFADKDLDRFSVHLLGKPYRKVDLAQRIRMVFDQGN